MIDIWDDPFHAAAWQAFAEGVARVQGIPDSRAVKARAYELYEARSREKQPAVRQVRSGTDGL